MSMYSLLDFNGSARRDRTHERIINDFTSRERFLEQQNNDRIMRDKLQQQINAAIIIQSITRSYFARKRVKSYMRSIFDGQINDTDQSLSVLIGHLLFFFNSDIDGQRLVLICQRAISAKHRQEDVQIIDNQYIRLYRCILQYIRTIASNRQQSFTIPLRFIQIFATHQHMDRLVELGYFVDIRYLFEQRIPISDVDDSLSPAADAILVALFRPIIVYPDSLQILHRLCCDLFDGTSSIHTISHMIRYLGKLTAIGQFSFDIFLTAILDNHHEMQPIHMAVLVYVVLSLLANCNYENPKVLVTLSRLIQSLPAPEIVSKRIINEDNDDDDDDDNNYQIEVDEMPCSTFAYVIRETINLIDMPVIKDCIISIACNQHSTVDVVLALAHIRYFVVRNRHISNNEPNLLYSLYARKHFIRSLWQLIQHCTSPTIFGQPRALLDNLERSIALSDNERIRFVPLLSFFCALLNKNIIAVDDDEFYDDDRQQPLASLVPFSKRDLARVTERLRNVSLGLIDLAFPDTDIRLSTTQSNTTDRIEWSSLFDSIVQLLKLLYERDARLHFMNDGFWSNHQRRVMINRQVFHSRMRGIHRQQQRPFSFVRFLTREQVEGMPQPSTTDLRNMTIMRRVPFVVPFLERVQIFQQLLNSDKGDHLHRRTDEFGPTTGPVIHLSVRRNFLYEDAFEKLSLTNVQDLKRHIRITMTNWVGLAEAGIDGGGIFREFLNELLKSAFDPHRGLFTTTHHDNLLYPNPVAMHLFPDDYYEHFYFLGRMLGKLIYENQLAELHFASFFLTKLLKNDETNDIYYLESMDPVLYNSVIYVKKYTGDISNLLLDFSVIIEQLGQVEKIDLKPNGRNIPVTNDNRLEYVQLFVNYYLNERLRAPVRALRAGISNVLDLDWLAMFSHRELQILISGVDADVDVADMRQFTIVTNMRENAEDEQFMQLFWHVVESLPAISKQKLLKFITGCSRPPLMGFRDLYPPLGIQLIADSDRLPSAATCMNLLKLPRFKTEEILRQKLVYAIEADAGFELS